MTMTMERGDGLRDLAEPAREIEQMASDYERARLCRERAQACREGWSAGEKREIAYVFQRAAEGDRRFRRMAQRELTVTGKSRWAHSPQARLLAGQEAKYIRWMEIYLAFAESHRPIRHFRAA